MDNERIMHGLSCFFNGTLKQRLNAFRNLAIERQFGFTKLSSFPVVLQVELTNACNLNCKMCSRHWSRLKTGEISDAVIEKVLPLFDYASEVALFGYGEPLLSKKFYYLLEEAKKRKVRASFFTNALLLDKKASRKIIESGVSGITFSLDGATAGTYNGIRGGSDFEKVVENIRFFVGEKKRLGFSNPDLRVEFVAMRQNIEELPALVELVASLGIKKLKVSHLVVWQKDFEKQSLLFHKNLCHEMFEKARQAARQCGISLDLPVDFSTAKLSKRPPGCFEPWYYAYIRFNGTVQACCYCDDFSMGSLLSDSFREIWNNKKYLALRKTVNSKKPPVQCSACEQRNRHSAARFMENAFLKLGTKKK